MATAVATLTTFLALSHAAPRCRLLQRVTAWPALPTAGTAGPPSADHDATVDVFDADAAEPRQLLSELQERAKQQHKDSQKIVSLEWKIVAEMNKMATEMQFWDEFKRSHVSPEPPASAA